MVKNNNRTNKSRLHPRGTWNSEFTLNHKRTKTHKGSRDLEFTQIMNVFQSWTPQLTKWIKLVKCTECN